MTQRCRPAQPFHSCAGGTLGRSAQMLAVVHAFGCNPGLDAMDTLVRLSAQAV